MGYNRNKLTELVRAGHLEDAGLPTEKWVYNGIGGYKFEYATKTGLVTRYDKQDNSFVFGVKDKSKHSTGYMCVEMLLPYNQKIHEYTSMENIIVDVKDKCIVGVQYTCYIHQIASIVADCLGVNGKTRGSIANHKDGCTIHNWLSNIETVTPTLNSWHAAVITSIKVNKNFFVKGTDCNAKYKFSYTNEISAYDIEAWMAIRPEFKAEVEKCAASLKNDKLENIYISTFELWGLYDYLKRNNKL